jgi:RecB family exonuclease
VRRLQPTSVSALDKIAACPLTWVLEHRAALRAGAVTTFASGPLLYGKLAHRLVEELHAGGAFEREEAAFLLEVEACFESLLPREGATLLLPGASIARLELTRHVRFAMRALHRYLARTGFRVASVEQIVTADAAIGALEGRLDLRLVDARGQSAVLDLKWGASKYLERLEKGRAVQLAVYARAVDASAPAPAGYFALLSGQIVAQDARMMPERAVSGPSLAETWRRVDATAKAVMETLARGEVPVSGVKRALPLLDALGVAGTERGRHLEHAPDGACEHCAYGAICGRQWEALA